MKLFRSASIPSSPRARRRFPRLAVIAGSVAVMLPIGLALAGGPASAAGARASASDASCPWLNQSLPISQRVSMLLAKMTLADKINQVTGGGFSEPYVFYIPAIPSLCVPSQNEEDGPVGVGEAVGRSMRFSLVSVQVVVLLGTLAVYGVNPNFALTV